MKRHPLAAFFVLAYAVSWLLWAPAALAHLGWIEPVPSRYLHLAGGLGPMLAAAMMTVVVGGRSAFSHLAGRCFSGGPWLALALAIPAVLFLLSAAIASGFLGETIDWSSVGRSTELPELPRPFYWLANVVFYGFGEEVGWRGYALPRLQARFSALRSSLLLALGWAGWHLPLFTFAEGLASLSAGGAVGWLVSLALGSILLTWLFNSSGGSVGSVALFHAALDIFMTSPVVSSDFLPNIMGALLTIGTLLLIPVFGRENLSRRPRVVEPG